MSPVLRSPGKVIMLGFSKKKRQNGFQKSTNEILLKLYSNSNAKSTNDD